MAYSANVQGRGWQPVVADGEVVGTTGESLPIEHFRVFVGGMPGVSVRYKAWPDDFTDPVADGQVIGRTAGALAVSIWLEGAPGDTGICYETHVAEQGWQPEVCDGEWAFDHFLPFLPIEALRIRLYGQPGTAAMSIPPTGMPYNARKAGEEPG